MRVASLAALCVVGLAVVAAVRALLWRRATAATIAQLKRSDGNPAAYAPDQVASTPAPVQRYFTFALSPGQPLIRHAQVRQRGEFLMRPGGAWSPFTAMEYFAVKPPGFVWDATIRMNPLVPVLVRDSHVAGQGAMRANAFGALPLVNEHGTREMAAASLQRYLAEAVWFPTALLPTAGVTWSAIDDSSARATVTDKEVTASVDFHFGRGGEVVSISADRYRDVSGTPTLTPWVGHFGGYERIGGMIIPRVGEVEWVLPQGPLPYWKGRITEAVFDFR